MKKLLSLLATATLVSTTASNVASCSLFEWHESPQEVARDKRKQHEDELNDPKNKRSISDCVIQKDYQTIVARTTNFQIVDNDYKKFNEEYFKGSISVQPVQDGKNSASQSVSNAYIDENWNLIVKLYSPLMGSFYNDVKWNLTLTINKNELGNDIKASTSCIIPRAEEKFGIPDVIYNSYKVHGQNTRINAIKIPVLDNFDLYWIRDEKATARITYGNYSQTIYNYVSNIWWDSNDKSIYIWIYTEGFSRTQNYLMPVPQKETKGTIELSLFNQSKTIEFNCLGQDDIAYIDTVDDPINELVNSTGNKLNFIVKNVPSDVVLDPETFKMENAENVFIRDEVLIENIKLVKENDDWNCQITFNKSIVPSELLWEKQNLTFSISDSSRKNVYTFVTSLENYHIGIDGLEYSSYYNASVYQNPEIIKNDSNPEESFNGLKLKSKNLYNWYFHKKGFAVNEDKTINILGGPPLTLDDKLGNEAWWNHSNDKDAGSEQWPGTDFYSIKSASVNKNNELIIMFDKPIKYPNKKSLLFFDFDPYYSERTRKNYDQNCRILIDPAKV